MKCLVVQIGKEDGVPFPANIMYPHIVKHVEDESDLFVVNAENIDQFWPAREFFFMEDVNEFEVLK